MHDHDDDHEHFGPGEEHDHVLWTRDRLRYTSVGIDIGSATTQVVFTDIEMRRLGGEMSSRFVAVSQTVLYASPIMFTPYLDGDAGIDADRVGEFVRESYGEAGQAPADVLAGVVLLTGNALLQRNSKSLAESIAAVQGDFVCHGAGHDMESRISAHGSGAVAASREQAITVLNVDVGGGTTKLATVRDGVVVATAAVGVGSRSLIFAEQGAITSVNEVAAAAGQRLGIELAIGFRPTNEDLERLADEMLGSVAGVIGGGAGRCSGPLLTAPLPAQHYDLVVASGGVAEYLAGESERGHGDMGSYLAPALRRMIDGLGAPVQVAGTPIRATVLGSARDTIQLSGNTIFVSDPAVLPIRNVPVFDLVDTLSAESESDAHTLLREIEVRWSTVEAAGAVAFAIDWEFMPTQRQLLDKLRLVLAAVAGLDAAIVVVLVLEQDLANLVGQIAKHELGLANPLVCIDGITTEDLDYVDVAGLDNATNTLQITMKSLLYGAVQ